ncbi:hypothetical protein MSG28_002284 [Choristoneura fumiferana]|uniref:Uncharacterized protein n=1 Tax=Choristoneura fumiferana TaxID=7141 RepID=A0ACC0JUT3_CHOFU|nr:hypothetical protein MSG28_002284 [Choristoneura fumiferana]
MCSALELPSVEYLHAQPSTSGAQCKTDNTTAVYCLLTHFFYPVSKYKPAEMEEEDVYASNVPSPAMFTECDGSSAGDRSNFRRPTNGTDIFAAFNLGSESESDDGDDDDAVALPVIPRVFRATLDTSENEPIDTIQPPQQSSLHPTFPAESPSSSTTLFEPNDFFDFRWSPFPIPPIQSDLRRELFSNINVGPTLTKADPYEIFVHIWDRQFMEHIVSETNKYAQQLATQFILNNNIRPSSRICDWKDTSVDELYVFLAITIAMGVVAKGQVVDYWNSDESIFITPGFRDFSYMPSNLSLPSHHISNRTVLVLNSSSHHIRSLQQNCAADEHLLQWKGWLEINQFISNKAAAVGIKTYEICESQTGYLWRFVVHARKRSVTAVPDSDPLQAFIPNLVLTLVQGLENKGHTLWMDNFYNSPALARKLKSLGFDCVGTLRTNRRFVPTMLADVTRAKMHPGEIIGLTSGDVDLLVWRNNNRVAMISTYHGNATAEIKGITKPAVVHDYNYMMGGVDKKDQMLAAFPIERKRTKVWYKKLFRRLLNVSVLNAYVICKHSKPISHRSFRMSLVQSMLKHHLPGTFPPVTLLQGLRNVYSVRDHHLAEYDLDPKLKGRKRRLCVVCKNGSLHTALGAIRLHA